MFDIKSTLPVDGIEEVEEELDLLRRVLLLLGRRRQPLGLAGERLNHLGVGVVGELEPAGNCIKISLPGKSMISRRFPEDLFPC